MKQITEEVRKHFSILETNIGKRPLIYLDNAATTQVPECVLETILDQYHHHQGNVHRGIHTLSERSTARMEVARETLRGFLGARTVEEIIFTAGTTQAVNLVARALSFGELGPGDEIVTTELEHHANLIPWQEACRRTGATLRVVPVTDRGELDLAAFAQCLTPRTKLTALTWVSNVTGTVNPLEELIPLAHRAGSLVLVDGAQAIRHMPLDMEQLDCDFFCLSGHKMMGPTGTGVLYGKRDVLEQLPPETFGGGMVDQVTDAGATYGSLPLRLEAGTPHIAGNIALGAAADFLQTLGMAEIAAREAQLLHTVTQALEARPDVQLVGAPRRRAGCVSFNLKGAHCFDVAQLLDTLGVAVRSGNHCAQPLLTALGQTGAVRISPAFYNTQQEMEACMAALDQVSAVLGGGRL